MEITYHPLVREDVIAILRYYRGISLELANEFHDELRRILDRAAESPLRFHAVDKDFRRANLVRFPYHVLYEVQSKSIRVMDSAP